MSETSLPPCGPERDRLVAQAVGWYFEDNMAVDYRDLDFPTKRIPSGNDADALAALWAWKAKTQGSVTIILDSAPGGAYVALEDFEAGVLLYGNCPTFADAATAALTKGNE